jgi:isopenicillin N synthase-like dioxygenase
VSVIPVINVAPPVAGSPDQARAVATALGSACRDVGNFYVTGHGIPVALMARAFENSAAFFAGPTPIREAVSFRAPSRKNKNKKPSAKDGLKAKGK